MPHPVSVILVEDDIDLREILVASLAWFGLDVRGAADAGELDAAFAHQAANILLLDLNLPGEGGNAIATRYRQAHPGIGIAMLTARGDRDSRVAGYADGADLYFVKPVDHEELATALQNLARRLGSKEADWVIDLQRSRIVAPDGTQTALTHNEALIVGAIAEAAGAAVKRETLYAATHDPDDEFAAQRLETALSRLRGKLRRDGLPPLPVRACHGAGYAFVDSVRILRPSGS